jgi:hypothetical protein
LVLLSHPLRAEIIATDLESLYGTMTEVLIDGLEKGETCPDCSV